MKTSKSLFDLRSVYTEWWAITLCQLRAMSAPGNQMVPHVQFTEQYIYTNQGPAFSQVHDKKCCSVFFFYLNAGFSVLCHFIGLFFYPSAGFSLLGHFIGLFFFLYLTTGLSLSPVKLLKAAAVSTGFLSPQETAVLSATDLVNSFGEIKVCKHLFLSI